MKDLPFPIPLPHDHFHCFNPSSFLMNPNNGQWFSFRHVPRRPEKYQHPWELWNTHSQIITASSTPFMSGVKHVKHVKHVKYVKHRDDTNNENDDLFSNSLTIVEYYQKYCPLDKARVIQGKNSYQDVPHVDSTCLVLKSSSPQHKENVKVYSFPSSIKFVDTRLIPDPQNPDICFWLVYNRVFYVPPQQSFHSQKWDTKDHMRYRPVRWNPRNTNEIWIGKERDMLYSLRQFSPKYYRDHEKNCQWDFCWEWWDQHRLLYHLTPSFVTYHPASHTLMESPNLLVEKIQRQENTTSAIVMSLGTSPIEWTSTTKLAVGHVKVIMETWKSHAPSNSPLSQFYQRWIQDHPNKYKYMYFSFFFEYDATKMTLLRFSPSFMIVKHEKSLEYPVQFPITLLSSSHTTCHLFFGEGDTECRNVEWQRGEIECFLIPIQEWTKEGIIYPFILLEPNV